MAPHKRELPPVPEGGPLVKYDPPLLQDERGCVVCGDGLSDANRQHCKACGHSVCEACSPSRIPLPQFKGFSATEEHRVCELCLEAILEERRQEQLVAGAAQAVAKAAETAAGLQAQGGQGGDKEEDAEAQAEKAQMAMKELHEQHRNADAAAKVRRARSLLRPQHRETRCSFQLVKCSDLFARVRRWRMRRRSTRRTSRPRP